MSKRMREAPREMSLRVRHRRFRFLVRLQGHADRKRLRQIPARRPAATISLDRGSSTATTTLDRDVAHARALERRARRPVLARPRRPINHIFPRVPTDASRPRHPHRPITSFHVSPPTNHILVDAPTPPPTSHDPRHGPTTPPSPHRVASRAHVHARIMAAPLATLSGLTAPAHVGLRARTASKRASVVVAAKKSVGDLQVRRSRDDHRRRSCASARARRRARGGDAADDGRARWCRRVEGSFAA